MRMKTVVGKRTGRIEDGVDTTNAGVNDDYVNCAAGRKLDGLLEK